MSLLDTLGLRRETPRIAPGSFANCDRLAAIHAEAFARPWGADEFEAFLTDAAIGVDCLLLGRDAPPSGFIVSRRTLDEAEILSLALARTVRGRGHSAVLLGHHLRWLADKGVTHVHLEVEEGNNPAISLYRRAGFVQKGRRPGYYVRPDGTRVSALSMTARLADRPEGARI